MRYTRIPTDTSDKFNDGVRPELGKVPKPLAALIRERDRVMAQRFAARHRVNELGTDQMTEAARQADDDAAAKAARGGADIPAPTALPKLEEDRTSAAQALEAQEAAFAAVTDDCEVMASQLYWDNLEDVAAERARIRSEIAAQASALADAVEAAVDSFSVSDWLRSGHYNRTATTWPTEVVDLRSHGLTREKTKPIRVRDAIIAAATTVLEEPTN